MLRRMLDGSIELVFDLDKPVSVVDVDRTQLEQIVVNLVLNARDAIAAHGASGGSGRITVALETADFDSEHVLAHPDAKLGPHTVLVVSDTGIGMDEATQARMFEPFFTTKEHGSGLGLASVYGIVKQHGGSMLVRSAPGTGTTFAVYLPCAVAREEDDAPLAPRVRAPQDDAPATILVVDDRPEIAELLRMMLTLDAHRVLKATSGEEALSLWREHRKSIDLMITDSRMPGMTGSELIQRIRSDAPQLPVLCTSAQTEDELAESGALATSVSFLEKPFTRTQLRTIVGHILRGRTVG
jgi:CheY-like chemotaxis protein